MKPFFTAARIVGHYWNQPVMWPSIWRTLQTGATKNSVSTPRAVIEAIPSV
jgi:hypothetical protein